jgi:hypothetical protein
VESRIEVDFDRIMWYVVWDIPRAMESKVSFRISPSIKREGVAAKATGRPALGVFRSHRDAEAEDGAALYLQARADDEDKDPTSPGEALKMAIPGAMVESTASTFERYRDAGCERAEAGDMSVRDGGILCCNLILLLPPLLLI